MQALEVEGTKHGAEGEWGREAPRSGLLTQPRGRLQLFEMLPLAVFAAAGKDGHVLTLLLPGHISCHELVVAVAGARCMPGGGRVAWGSGPCWHAASAGRCWDWLGAGPRSPPWLCLGSALGLAACAAFTWRLDGLRKGLPCAERGPGADMV